MVVQKTKKYIFTYSEEDLLEQFHEWVLVHNHIIPSPITGEKMLITDKMTLKYIQVENMSLKVYMQELNFGLIYYTPVGS